MTHVSHDEVVLLLPWWVNGTLQSAERRAVETHLDGCAACRAEAVRCRELAAAVAGSDELAAFPSAERLERLLKRLDDGGREAEVAEDPAGDAPSAGRRLVALTRRGAARWVIGLQLAAILVLASGVAWLSHRPEPADPGATASAPSPFRTLERDRRSAPGAGHLVRVVFAPDTPEATLREVVLEVRGRLVGGPSPLGAYTLEVPAGTAADPLPLVLEYLRRRPEVRLAEPAAGRGGESRR